MRYESKGVVLIISPWNFPINLTFNPLISAIAAGNTAIAATTTLNYSIQKVYPHDTTAYTQGLVYNLNPKLAVTSRLGYGVAVERAASAGNFSQNNNVTGSFALGCVIYL